ncbi:MAG: electron transfer flavoprotein subunit alpha/FixB family protein [Bryobacterales bacterium]|nr:electron transfer flavoprotein subunit alpha/FixB family protein [Bryobacterales bacterium]
MSVLVVMERTGGRWHRTSWETLAAGQQIAASLGVGASAVVLGGSAAELADKRLAKAITVEHELLNAYSADGYTAALSQVIEREQPSLVLFPHTYQVRDYAPKLATRRGRTLVSDVVQVRVEGGALVMVRQLFQGRLNADYRCAGEGPHFASIQAGAYQGDAVAAGGAELVSFPPTLENSAIRTRAEEPFRESARAVDLSSAEMIVSVGRGIKEQENMPVVEALAQALGAEMAASRPICDNGWLPMERQVGSSGQTVSPKVYFAIGISGAIQHLVGMKGSKTIVAINKDANAPIFDVADYGIVGDLFEVVPALTEAVRKIKG